MWKKFITSLAGVAVVLLSFVVPAGKASAETTALPAPYSGWNVAVEPINNNPHILHLTFNSPLLGQRVTNTVYLPESYSANGPALPVMYALHGTVFSPLDNCALNAVTSQETLVRMIGCGGGYLQDNLYDIPSQLNNMRFMVVSPDTSPTDSICETCMWVNGRSDLIPNIPPITAKELPADSFLHQELYPLVQALFNARTDRGGRGVMGFSMGGWAAALQGMIHPDDYSYIGYVSGGYDIKELELQSTIIEPIGYFRDQGYSTSVTDPIWWQQYNPKDIATNLKGANTDFLLSSGDACLTPGDLLSAPECQGVYSPVRSPSGTLLEQELSLNHTIAVNDLKAKGIPFQTVRTPGTHGANNAGIFAKYIVPGANAKFAAPTPEPKTFSYRTALTHFSIWGYQMDVRRTGDSFLTMNQTNDHSLTISGTGNVDITTPASFTEGSTHAISNGGKAIQRATAGSDGRLHFTVDAGAITIS